MLRKMEKIALFHFLRKCYMNSARFYGKLPIDHISRPYFSFSQFSFFYDFFFVFCFVLFSELFEPMGVINLKRYSDDFYPNFMINKLIIGEYKLYIFGDLLKTKTVLALRNFS